MTPTNVLEPAMIEALDLPLWGYTPPFPLDAFASALCTSLAIDTCHVEVLQSTPLSTAALEKRIRSPYAIYPIAMDPLGVDCSLVIEETERTKLFSIAGQAQTFDDSELNEGFYDFIVLNALSALNVCNPYPGLHFKQSSKVEALSSGYLVQLAITFPEEKMSCFLLFSNSAWARLKEHFHTTKTSLRNIRLPSDLFFSLSLHLGETTISRSEWKSAKVGDLLLLDQAYFNPINQSGSLQIHLGNTPLFQAKVKKEGIKILDYLLDVQEIPMSETKDPFDDFENPPQNEVPPFDDQPESSLEDHNEELLETPTPHAEGMHHASSEAKEFASPHLPEEGLTATDTLEEIDTDTIKKVPLDAIDLDLRVEAGRIQTSIERLQNLKPGSVLPLDLSFEKSVFVTYRGKAIAKGEVVHFDEQVGVKLTEIFG